MQMTVSGEIQTLIALTIIVRLQSMVCCNQLVVQLAKLLQSLSKPELLTLQAQGKAQLQGMQLTRAATHPNAAASLGTTRSTHTHRVIAEYGVVQSASSPACQADGNPEQARAANPTSSRQSSATDYAADEGCNTAPCRCHTRYVDM